MSEVATIQFWAHLPLMPERDVNEEASRLVNDLTESEPVNGEDLIESEDLKRQFREAKERLLGKSPPSARN
jgi:hypothetical protein